MFVYDKNKDTPFCIGSLYTYGAVGGSRAEVCSPDTCCCRKVLWDSYRSVMAVATGWSSWFWSEEFWLPPNTTWEGLTAARNPKFVQFGEMYMCLPIAVILIIIRVIFEK